jgi:Escherichia/Staphylococcus phage prohead protease
LPGDFVRDDLLRQAIEGFMKSQTIHANYEKKFSPLDLSQVETDGTFSGYASLFGKEDMGHDIVLPGAFKPSLDKRGAAGIKLLYQHDPNEPIGVWSDIHEDEIGLFVKGRLLPDVSRAKEVLSLMRAGALDGLSIGFKTVKAKRNSRNGTRSLSEVDLWEISIVTFPMLPDARINSVKNRIGQDLPTQREFERWLTQDAGFTRAQARTVIRDGFKTVVVKQDAAGRSNDGAVRLIGKINEAAKRLKSYCDEKGL